MDMDHARCAPLIDDLVDGALAPAEAAAVAAHCAACPECGRALETTRAVLAAARALPREQAPPPALWDAVAARTVARRRAPWLAYAAAATVVAAIGGVIAARLPAPAPAAPQVAAVAPLGAPVHAIANPAMERRAHLVSDGTRDGKRLDPQALAAVERNMKVIHAALAEIETAVAANPNDPNLRRLLTEIHLQEAALIERTQRLSIEPNRRTDI